MGATARWICVPAGPTNPTSIAGRVSSSSHRPAGPDGHDDPGLPRRLPILLDDLQQADAEVEALYRALETLRAGIAGTTRRLEERAEG